MANFPRNRAQWRNEIQQGLHNNAIITYTTKVHFGQQQQGKKASTRAANRVGSSRGWVPFFFFVPGRRRGREKGSVGKVSECAIWSGGVGISCPKLPQHRGRPWALIDIPSTQALHLPSTIFHWVIRSITNLGTAAGFFFAHTNKLYFLMSFFPKNTGFILYNAHVKRQQCSKFIK